MRSCWQSPYRRHVDVRDRVPWYLSPRSMGKWQSRLLLGFTPLMFLSIGFGVGWIATRYSDAGQNEFEAATPSWLGWSAVRCAGCAVAVYAVARLASPPYDPDSPGTTRNRPDRAARCVDGVISVLCLIVPLVISSLVATHSAYRWTPIVVGAICVLILPLVLWINATRSRT